MGKRWVDEGVAKVVKVVVKGVGKGLERRGMTMRARIENKDEWFHYQINL